MSQNIEGDPVFSNERPTLAEQSRLVPRQIIKRAAEMMLDAFDLVTHPEAERAADRQKYDHGSSIFSERS